MRDYWLLEQKRNAASIRTGDTIATYDRRRTQPVFRTVTRTSDNDDGTVSLFVAGRVMPERLPQGAEVTTRVRRTR
jgi:hypothetical protein